MKNPFTVGVAFLVLTASGWCGAAPLNIPELCHGFVNDAANRIYLGKFEQDDVSLDTALVVTPTKNSAGETKVFYLWGAQPAWDIPEAGCVRETAVEEGDTLTIRMRGLVRVTYEFSGDEASVKYTRNARTTHGKVALSTAAISVPEQQSSESEGEAAQTAASAANLQSSEVAAALVDSVYEGEWRKGFLYKLTFSRYLGKKMRAKVHVIDSDAARTRFNIRADVEIQGPQVRLRWRGVDRVDHLTFDPKELKLTGFSVYRGNKVNRQLWAKRVD